ncbi:GNAT family N-acetyltransferase [Enterococcus faecium]
MLENLKKWAADNKINITIEESDMSVNVYLGEYEISKNEWGGIETTYSIAHMSYYKEDTKISMLHVCDDFRNRGIASALVEAAVELGADCVLAEPLLTEKERDLNKLIGFYSKFGFNVYAKNTDSAWMVR